MVGESKLLLMSPKTRGRRKESHPIPLTNGGEKPKSNQRDIRRQKGKVYSNKSRNYPQSTISRRKTLSKKKEQVANTMGVQKVPTINLKKKIGRGFD